MMFLGSPLLEWFKVALQSLVTLGAAYLAVVLALRRYKREKTWERQLTAYADTCVALRDLRTVIAQWRDETMQHRETSEEWQTFQRERYRGARRGITSSIALADLLLPSVTLTTLIHLDRKLDDSYGLDPFERYEDQISLIDEALERIAHHGREVLGIRHKRIKLPA